MKKLWAVLLTFWTLALAVWTVFCWSAWEARAAEIRDNTQAARKKHQALLDVPFISQVEDFPTGCESVSAVMALQYFGVDVSVDDFIDGYLPLGKAPYWSEDGVYTGCDPRLAFPGDPRSEGGWGCCAPVIEDALNRLLADKPKAGLAAKDLTGKELSALCGYVDEGTPVLVWATIGMEKPSVSDVFLIEGTEEFYSWMYPMHCLVLTGYDKENYYFNDPMEQKNTAYPKAAVERAYEGLGKQALIVTRKSC